MPRKCSICTHPKKVHINRALMNPNNSLREIAVKYRASQSAPDRHRAHITNAVQVARKNGDSKQGKRAPADGDGGDSGEIRRLW